MDKVDDIPVAGENGSYDFEAKMAQMELEYQKQKEAEEQEFNLPLEKKILSKNWKCRKCAIEELHNQISSLQFTSDLFKLFPQILQDQHQTNLEQSLDCLNFYYEKTNEGNGNGETNAILLDIVKYLIEKCYTSSKTSFKEKSKNAIIKTVEKMQSTDSLCDLMVNMLNSKNQKITQGVIEVSRLLMIEFGSEAFNYKIIFPAMIRLIDSCMPMIKSEIIEFGKELYKWIRGGIKKFIENKLKDSIMQDFTKAFEGSNSINMSGLIPMHYLKGQSMDTMAIRQPRLLFEKESKAEPLLINETIEEIDLFGAKTLYTEKWCEDILKPECKWKEKKEMLEAFIASSQNVKIKQSDRYYFIEMLKQLLKDANINVVNCVIISIGNLAKGLKEGFTEGKELFSILLEFFKEKKEKFSNDLMVTLNNIYNFVDDNVISDIILKFSLQTLPTQSREKICLLIANISQEKLTTPNKNYLDILIKYSDDASLEVRTASLKSLAVLKQKFGNINELNALQDNKIKKIEEYIYINGGSLDDHVSLAKPQTIIIKPNSNQHQQQHQPIKPNEDKTQNNKKPLQGNNAVSSAIIVDDNDQGGEEEIDDYFKATLGNELYNMFNEDKWALRRDAFISLKSFIQDHKDEVNNQIDQFLKLIFSKTKKYKENNIAIIKEALTSLQAVCENCQSFSKKHSQQLIVRLIEKISDNKIKTQMQSLLLKFVEYHGPKTIITCLIKSADNKSVLILKETALLISKTIDEFDIGSFPIKDIVEFSKTLLTNSNAQARNSAISLLCSLYKYIGDPIKSFLNDIKEATKKAIEEEFSKITVVANDNSNKEKRELKGEAAKEVKPKGNLMDNAFPRVDISKRITPKMLKDLIDGKWQLKKEVLDAIEGIINDSNKRISPNGLHDLFDALKQKLKDGNKNMIRFLIQFITKLIEALGPGIKSHMKYIIMPILRNLSDKMNLLREDIVKCLQKLIEIIGFESVAISFPLFLAEENFELRSELLKLLMKYKDSIAKFDGIKEFIPAIISCLLDKSPSIRAIGEEYAKEMLRYVNISMFYIHLKSFKPAIANSVKMIIDKYASLICVDVNDMNVEMKDLTNTNENANKPNQSGGGGERVNRQLLSNANNNNINKPKNVSLERKNESKSNEPFLPKPNIKINNSNNNSNNNINIIPPITNLAPISSDLLFQNNKRKQSYEITTQEIQLSMKSIYQKPITTLHPIEENLHKFELSKSPLLLLHQQKVCKDESSSKKQNLFIKYNDKIDQEQLSVLISSLYTGDISDKYSSLFDIGDLFNEPSSSTLHLIEKNIRDIFTSFNSLLSSTFELINQPTANNNTKAMTLLRYLLTAYYKISICKQSLERVSIDIIYCTYERLLLCILTDNLETLLDGKRLIKSLNGLVIKFLENFSITNSLIALIRLISNYKSNENSRIFSLGIRCILKISNIMSSIYNEIEIEKILIVMFEFLFEFEKTNSVMNPKNQNEDMCIKVLKTILHEIIKIGNESIWDYYKKAIEKNNFPDKYIKRWIQLLLRSRNGMSQPKPLNLSTLLNKTDLISNAANQGNSNPQIEPTNLIISPFKSNHKLNSNILASISQDSRNKTSTIYNELKVFIERLTSTKEKREKDTNIYEIVSILKHYKLNVEYMADKLNENDYTLLLKIYHSIEDTNSADDYGKSKSTQSICNNKHPINIAVNNEMEKEEFNKPGKNNLQNQMKTLQEYRNKLYGLSDKDKTPTGNTNVIGDTENININIDYRKQQFEELKLKREKLNALTKNNLTINNSIINTSNTTPNIQYCDSLISNSNKSINLFNNNNNFEINNNIQTDRLAEMRKKLHFLRQQSK